MIEHQESCYIFLWSIWCTNTNIPSKFWNRWNGQKKPLWSLHLWDKCMGSVWSFCISKIGWRSVYHEHIWSGFFYSHWHICGCKLWYFIPASNLEQCHTYSCCYCISKKKTQILQNGRRQPFWVGQQCYVLNWSEILEWSIKVLSLKERCWNRSKVIGLATKWRWRNHNIPENLIYREYNYMYKYMSSLKQLNMTWYSIQRCCICVLVLAYITKWVLVTSHNLISLPNDSVLYMRMSHSQGNHHLLIPGSPDCNFP